MHNTGRVGARAKALGASSGTGRFGARCTRSRTVLSAELYIEREIAMRARGTRGENSAVALLRGLGRGGSVVPRAGRGVHRGGEEGRFAPMGSRAGEGDRSREESCFRAPLRIKRAGVLSCEEYYGEVISGREEG